MTPQNEEIPRQDREWELLALLQSGLARENTGLHALLSYLGKKSLENGDGQEEYTIGVEEAGPDGLHGHQQAEGQAAGVLPERGRGRGRALPPAFVVGWSTTPGWARPKRSS